MADTSDQPASGTRSLSIKAGARALLARAGTLHHGPRGAACMMLGYHHVSDRAEVGFVAPNSFREQMAALASHRSNVPVLALGEALERLASGTAPRRSVVITFDDGYSDNHEHALPELLAHGLTATIFIPTALIGRPGYLSETQVRELVEAGVTIGSHSRSHADLRGCRPSQLDDEVRGSREDLERLVGREISAFAYPYGHHDLLVRTAVGRAGYSFGIGARRGWATSKSDYLRVPRQFVEECSIATFRHIARGGLNVLAPVDSVRARHRHERSDTAVTKADGQEREI